MHIESVHLAAPNRRISLVFTHSDEQKSHPYKLEVKNSIFLSPHSAWNIVGT